MPKEPALRADLLALFEAYSAHTGLATSTLSARVNGDARFHERLASGEGTFTVAAYDRAVAEFAHVWPATLEWPEGIEKIQLSEIRTRPRKPRRKNAA